MPSNHVILEESSVSTAILTISPAAQYMFNASSEASAVASPSHSFRRLQTPQPSSTAHSPTHSPPNPHKEFLAPILDQDHRKSRVCIVIPLWEDIVHTEARHGESDAIVRITRCKDLRKKTTKEPPPPSEEESVEMEEQVIAVTPDPIKDLVRVVISEEVYINDAAAKQSWRLDTERGEVRRGVALLGVTLREVVGEPTQDFQMWGSTVDGGGSDVIGRRGVSRGSIRKFEIEILEGLGRVEVRSGIKSVIRKTEIAIADRARQKKTQIVTADRLTRRSSLQWVVVEDDARATQ
ncbi:hypothetical protein ACLOJK_035095 [Asimina triloba]